MRERGPQLSIDRLEDIADATIKQIPERLT
jgi:hypothetical protein